MIVTITFKLDESWDEYKNVSPELLAEDMDLLHKDGIEIKKIKVNEFSKL